MKTTFLILLVVCFLTVSCSEKNKENEIKQGEVSELLTNQIRTVFEASLWLKEYSGEWPRSFAQLDSINKNEKWKEYAKLSAGNITDLDSTKFEQINFISDSSKHTVNYKLKSYSSSDYSVLENQGKLVIYPLASDKNSTLVIETAEVESNESKKSFEDLYFEFEAPVFLEQK